MCSRRCKLKTTISTALLSNKMKTDLSSPISIRKSLDYKLKFLEDMVTLAINDNWNLQILEQIESLLDDWMDQLDSNQDHIDNLCGYNDELCSLHEEEYLQLYRRQNQAMMSLLNSSAFNDHQDLHISSNHHYPLLGQQQPLNSPETNLPTVNCSEISVFSTYLQQYILMSEISEDLGIPDHQLQQAEFNSNISIISTEPEKSSPVVWNQQFGGEEFLKRELFDTVMREEAAADEANHNSQHKPETSIAVAERQLTAYKSTLLLDMAQDFNRHKRLRSPPLLSQHTITEAAGSTALSSSNYLHQLNPPRLAVSDTSWLLNFVRTVQPDGLWSAVSHIPILKKIIPYLFNFYSHGGCIYSGILGLLSSPWLAARVSVSFFNPLSVTQLLRTAVLPISSNSTGLFVERYGAGDCGSTVPSQKDVGNSSVISRLILGPSAATGNVIYKRVLGNCSGILGERRFISSLLYWLFYLFLLLLTAVISFFPRSKFISSVNSSALLSSSNHRFRTFNSNHRSTQLISTHHCSE